MNNENTTIHWQDENGKFHFHALTACTAEDVAELALDGVTATHYYHTLLNTRVCLTVTVTGRNQVMMPWFREMATKCRFAFASTPAETHSGWIR